MLIIDMANRSIVGSYHDHDGKKVRVGEHFGTSAKALIQFEASVTYHEELRIQGEIRYINED